MSSNMAAVPMSFAKVAASGGKENVALNSFARTGAPARDTRIVSVHEDIEPGGNQINVSTVKDRNPAIVDNAPAAQQTSAGETNLVDAVKALSIHNVTPSLVVNGSGGNSGTSRKVEVAEAFSEDPFQRTDSGSDLGTKPPSLDGKSITSGTTFALDEKESLRPDDSASVKAAEDDDTFSGRGSIVAGSRIGSEAAARAYRSQFVYESSERRNMLPMQESQGQGAITPQSGSSGQQAAEDVKNKAHVGAPGTTEAFGLFYRQTPDEKLLEALESPKDRIFLLRLEQDVIEFVKDSKEPFIDLPPCNSFCRMLTHKLADYYHMTHQVDAVAGAVRIFRTPFCRIPPPLTSISNPPTTGNTPPPSMPAMKIMRRGGDGGTGTNASKANSETGSDGKDKSLSAKEKLSREEREAAYNKARERIFGKEEKTGDATPETEDGNGMSRSSSVSTKDRSGQSNKRGKSGKQRRDDDSFETRSLYTPVFPQQQQQQQAAWAPVTQYTPMGPQQFVPPYPNSYMGPMPTQYGPPPQQFNPTMISGNMQPYSNITQYPQPTHQQPNQQRYQPQSAPGTTFASPTHSPQPPSQQWQQPSNGYPNSFQQRAVMTGPGTQGTIPYAFGQLPSTANPADPKSQHPIPGSFNRHAFNPKTQSFVPGNTGLPVQQPMSHHGSPHHGSPHLSYNNYAPPQQQFSNGQQFGNGMGYSMARQGSNSSVPSYHASPHMAHRQMMQNMSQGMPQGLPQGMPQNMPQGMQSNVQAGSHLPNFGNPSTLPPKPPPAV